MCVGCNYFGEKEDGKLGCIAKDEAEKQAGCDAMAQKTPGGCGCGGGDTNKCN